VIKLTSNEHGENVSVVASSSASGIHISPIVKFKGVRFTATYRADLTLGSVAHISHSRYIIVGLFLK